jgi:hypothetical protein
VVRVVVLGLVRLEERKERIRAGGGVGGSLRGGSSNRCLGGLGHIIRRELRRKVRGECGGLRSRGSGERLHSANMGILGLLELRLVWLNYK